ncbi:MAG TPA: FMN-binding negative transcriptional regulator [Isosphaeraceae bacterium]|jgi:transcriptional regulator|nr:FMN-binding negative transcriptional regulator [Isosphaeraceae bacterium]
MYIPAAFSEPDPATLREFLRRSSFALLVSQGDGGLVGSHLPLLLADDPGPPGRLVGHMARANRQWRDVRGEVMAVFSGPHAYVSPTWYEEPGTVPTWNYVAVHAYGTFHVVDDRGELLDILRRSVAVYEGSRPRPWTFDESEPAIRAMLEAIVGFRIEVTRLEGKWKLSQNHSDDRRRRVIRALEDRPDDDSRTIARWMAEALDGPRPDPGGG